MIQTGIQDRDGKVHTRVDCPYIAVGSPATVARVVFSQPVFPGVRDVRCSACAIPWDEAIGKAATSGPVAAAVSETSPYPETGFFDRGRPGR